MPRIRQVESSYQTRSRTRGRGTDADEAEAGGSEPNPINDPFQPDLIPNSNEREFRDFINDLVNVVPPSDDEGEGDYAVVPLNNARDNDDDDEVRFLSSLEPPLSLASHAAAVSNFSLSNLAHRLSQGNHQAPEGPEPGTSNNSPPTYDVDAVDSEEDDDDVLFVGSSSGSNSNVDMMNGDDDSIAIIHEALAPEIQEINQVAGQVEEAVSFSPATSTNASTVPVPGTSSDARNRDQSGSGGSTRNVSPNTVSVQGDRVRDDVDDDEEEEESRGPPQKMPRLDTSVRSDDDDGFNCQICYEQFTNSGEHRVCCLKCGHIYGKECIERWIKTSKRCPACCCKATPKDIRILYVKNLKAADTTELNRLKEEVDKLKVEKNKIELRNAQLRFKEEIQSKEITKLQQEIAVLNRRQPEVIDIAADVSPPSRALSDSKLHNQALSSNSGYLRMPKLQLIKHFDIKEGQSRVGASSEWLNLLVVSHSITNRLFPGGSYGIKKINTLDMNAFQSFPIHQKALRDMSFCSSQADLLLTVGLDKKAVLFNCNSNCAVQTFLTQAPLWSCCWNTVSQNIFYLGNLNGLVTAYDIRAPQEPLSTLTIPTSDKSAVGRLKFVPPSYQSQSFNMSGLLIQKLNTVWLAEMLGGSADDQPRYHQLPIEGHFVNADFDAGSRHVLLTARPKMSGQVRMGTSHVVCNLGKTYSATEERDVFSCDVVQSFYGGVQESSIICRSALFSPQPGQVYVAANGEGIRTVRVWDISNTEQKTLVRINQDAALDFIPGKVNETNFLGIVTEKSMDVYDVK